MNLTAGSRNRAPARYARSSRARLTVELLESRNLFDAGLANVLVNDPNLDYPMLVTNPDGTTEFFSRDTQSETALVLGAGNRVIVAYNDTGSEIYFNGMVERVGFAVSQNGGTSFTDMGRLPLNTFGSFYDPVLARSERSGTIFLTTLTWARDLGWLHTGRLNIFRSLDEGRTFELPVNGTPGFVPYVDLQDKPWITVDNFAGAEGSGYGNVYLAWTDFSNENSKSGLYFSRSTGDGAEGTWGPDGGIFLARGNNKDPGNVPIDAFVTVGPDHAVYVFWLNYYGLSLQMRKSTDQGLTFGPPVIVAKLEKHSHNADLGLTDSDGNIFRADGAPQVVVHPTTGDLYLIYADKPKSAKDRADIFFVQSTDGGQTWSPRRRVNDDATTTDQWQPALAITPDGERVGIFWYDRRLDTANNNLIDRFGARVGLGFDRRVWSELPYHR